MLTEERRLKILDRVTRLLKEIDGDVRLHEVLLDSTRQQLAFVMQRGEWPLVVGMTYLDYVSLRDGELKERLAEGLRHRLAVAQQRRDID